MKITNKQPTVNSSFEYAVRDTNGQFLQTFPDQPSLRKLRQIDRESEEPLERIDVLDADLYCSICGDRLSERFSATQGGKLICIECGTETDSEGQTKHPTDPTKAVLSSSSLNHKNLCNYVINVATGCSHGCKFCYVPSTPNIKTRGEMLQNQAGVEDSQKEWGSYLLYRDDLPERLSRKLQRKRTWDSTPDGRGVVMISSGTDCYQDRRAAQITRGCVIELVKHNKPVRILTRSPAVVRDLDVFKAANGLVTVGSSIPCLDDDLVRAIEPGAPAPSARLDALEEISNAGVPVYVSMSPTYPTQDREDLRELLVQFKDRLDPDVVFHEPINPRGGNFQMTVQAARDAGQKELAEELDKLRDRDHWVEYSRQQLKAVRDIGEDLGLPIHLWPDKKFVKHAGDDEEYFREQLEKMESPEDYPITPSSA